MRDNSKRSQSIGTERGVSGQQCAVSVAIALVTLCLSGLGHAQDATTSAQLEEIIVTAQKREENLQRTTVTVTAVDAKAVEALGANSLYDLARIAPNTEFGGSQQGSVIFIRGIGQTQQTVLSDPGATMYVDGVYRPILFANSTNFTDLARMEVLRGPQGTLFGKNTIGGAVNIITALPSDEFGGSIDVMGGSRDRLKVDGSLNVPLVQDTLAARFSVQSNTQDGFMRNYATGGRLANTDYYTARSSLLWTASDAVDVTLRADYTDQDQKGPGAKLLPPSTSPYYTSDPWGEYGTAESFSRATDKGTSLTVDWKIGPGTLKSISAYRKFASMLNEDADGTPDPLQENLDVRDDEFFSEELQYNAKSFGGRLDWTVGGFYLDDDVSQEGHPRIPPIVSLDNYMTQKAKNYAVFAQGTFDVTDAFAVTLGARYSRDEKDTTFTSISAPGGLAPAGVVQIAGVDNKTWSAVTPKLSLQYQITPDAMVYGTASKGYKAGGFNGTPFSAADFLSFNPEYVWNYEAGVKTEWLDRRLRVNVTAFFMDYTDTQVMIEQVPITIHVENAGDAEIKGVEGEFAFLPIESLMLNASFGINDFEYTRLAPSAATSGLTLDNVLPFAPKYNATGGFEYTAFASDAGKLTVRSDYSWRNKYYTDAVNNEQISQGSYGLWSARITYSGQDNRWAVYAYGLNLSNAEYHVFGNSAFASTLGYVAGQGAPRELGLGARFNLGR
jgi:iron complex outermembrane receptor protein